jgi:hypothetical protein
MSTNRIDAMSKHERLIATAFVLGSLSLTGCQTVYDMFAGTFRVADTFTGTYDENLREQGIDPDRARHEMKSYDR